MSRQNTEQGSSFYLTDNIEMYHIALLMNDTQAEDTHFQFLLCLQSTNF